MQTRRSGRYSAVQRWSCCLASSACRGGTQEGHHGPELSHRAVAVCPALGAQICPKRALAPEGRLRDTQDRTLALAGLGGEWTSVVRAGHVLEKPCCPSAVGALRQDVRNMGLSVSTRPYC